MGVKGCLPLMASGNAHVVVASVQVELGVDLATAELVKELVTSRIGYRSFLVSLLRFLKSTQSCRVPSFFFANRTGAPAGDWDDQMNPLPSMSSRNSRRRPSSVPESG